MRWTIKKNHPMWTKGQWQTEAEGDDAPKILTRPEAKDKIIPIQDEIAWRIRETLRERYDVMINWNRESPRRSEDETLQAPSG